MTRTSPAVLLAVAVVGVMIGFGIDQLLTSSGRPTFTPSILLSVLLVGLAAALVMLALPIRKATRGPLGKPVDPFRAVRVVILAKSSSVAGAAVTGVASGLLLFLLTRPVAPAGDATGTVVTTVIGGLALVIAALVAEYLCTVGKDDDDDQPEPGEPDLGLSHH